MSKKKKNEAIVEVVETKAQIKLQETKTVPAEHVIILSVLPDDKIVLSTTYEDYPSLHAVLNRAGLDVTVAHNRAVIAASSGE